MYSICLWEQRNTRSSSPSLLALSTPRASVLSFRTLEHPRVAQTGKSMQHSNNLWFHLVVQDLDNSIRLHLSREFPIDSPPSLASIDKTGRLNLSVSRVGSSKDVMYRCSMTARLPPSASNRFREAEKTGKNG